MSGLFPDDLPASPPEALAEDAPAGGPAAPR